MEHFVCVSISFYELLPLPLCVALIVALNLCFEEQRTTLTFALKKYEVGYS